MADKILKTRIKLRYDTLENWNANKTKILLEGEVAVVAVKTNTDNPSTMTPPQILFKVGDGKTTFESLPWASGMAADVYEWAKQQELPTETNGTGNVITNVEWNTAKDKLVITKGNITIPGGTGSVHSQGTSVVTDVELNNHTLSGKTKTIAGHSASGINVELVGSASTIQISGPEHTVNSNLPSSSIEGASYTLTQDDSTKAITATRLPFTQYYDVASADIDLEVSNRRTNIFTYWLGDNNKDSLEFGILGQNGSGIKITKDNDHPVYFYQNKRENIALASDIPTIPNLNFTGDIPKYERGETIVITDITGSGHTINRTYGTAATKTYVDNKVAGSVQYLGLATSVTSLSTTAGKGDFYRANFDDSNKDVSKGDLLIAAKDNPSAIINDTTGYSIVKSSDDYKGTVKSVTVTGTNGLTGTGTITETGTITLSHAPAPAEGSGTEWEGQTQSSVATGANVDEFGHITDMYFGKIKGINTNNTSAQPVLDHAESLLGADGVDEVINLHKISKTGNYNDLNNKPTIPTVNNGKLTISNGTGISGGPIEFTANQATATTKSLSVKNWATSLYYKTDDLKLRDNSENYIVLDGGAAGTW